MVFPPILPSQTVAATSEFSCSDCDSRNCYRNEAAFPKECATIKNPAGTKATRKLYQSDSAEAKLLKAAGEVEAEFYGRMTRIEETVTLAKKMGYQKIGIASCLALMNEATIFADCLRSAELEPKTVICKVGSIDKCELGVADEMKLLPGHKEATCNPVLQAQILNKWGSDMNVVMGLCVGHDCLFNLNSAAPTTTLVVKDRVLGHNPVAGFYLSKTFYSRILDYAKYPKPRQTKK
jgi:uncharacterized metal-binding protein